MIHITEDQVRHHLTIAKAIELMGAAFRDLASGAAVNHPRRRVVLRTGSILHYMPAGNADYFGIKCYSTNPKTGAHFTFLLYRSDDGMPVASFEANALGQIRTGAVSGFATDLLARKDASVMGVIGTGFQAETQVRAVMTVRDLKDVRVFGRDSDRRESFARKLGVRAVGSASAAVEGAEIIITATGSKEPVLQQSWVSPGAHINAMGSNWANRRELPSDLVLGADVVVVDDKEAGLLEAGDLLLAGLPAGKWIELKDVATGKVQRSSPDQITIFKSNGLAIEDVVAAAYVYEQVLAQGSGVSGAP